MNSDSAISDSAASVAWAKRRRSPAPSTRAKRSASATISAASAITCAAQTQAPITGAGDQSSSSTAAETGATSTAPRPKAIDSTLSSCVDSARSAEASESATFSPRIRVIVRGAAVSGARRASACA